MTHIGQAVISVFLLHSLLTGTVVRILWILPSLHLLALRLKSLALRSAASCSQLPDGDSFPTERLWLPSGPADGGRHAGGLLHHGSALVCGCNRPVHYTREQPQAGVGMLCPGGAAQVPGHPRTESHGPHDLRAHGLLGVHDSGLAGIYSSVLSKPQAVCQSAQWCQCIHVETWVLKQFTLLGRTVKRV